MVPDTGFELVTFSLRNRRFIKIQHVTPHLFSLSRTKMHKVTC
nr:MAG TPA: hypothetical protein [Caudoviricetes sp.]